MKELSLCLNPRYQVAEVCAAVAEGRWSLCRASPSRVLQDTLPGGWPALPPRPQRRRLLRTVVLGSETSWQSETPSHGLGTLNRGPCRAEPAPGTGPVHLGLHRGLSVRPGPRLACIVLARLEAGRAEVCSQHQWAVRVRHWSLLLGRGTAWGRDFTRQNPIPR